MEFSEHREKKRLSRSILDMKFMKKSKEKAFKDEEDEQGKAVFASEVTEAMKIGGRKFIMEPSYVPCENLIMGRLSYNGMNPDIERLLELERLSKLPVKKEKPEVDVSDEQMAERYSTVVGTIANKFKSKYERDTSSPMRKKTKFMKPADDD